MSTTYEFTCEWCQNDIVLYDRSAYQAERRGRQFCSKSCANSWRNRQKADRAREEKLNSINERVVSAIPGTKLIPLGKGKVAIVDESYYEEMSKYTWYAFPRENNTYYAVSGTGGGHQNGEFYLMHRLIVERVLGRALRLDETVHHIDENPLNNSESNLLVCTIGYHAWLQRMIRKRKKQVRGEAKKTA